jgi:hypothetical protein
VQKPMDFLHSQQSLEGEEELWLKNWIPGKSGPPLYKSEYTALG